MIAPLRTRAKHTRTHGATVRNRNASSAVPYTTNDPEGGTEHMGIGVSLILIAAGAILTWAVDATVSGLNIHTVGVILMVVGLVGLVLSLVFWSSWGGPTGIGGRRRTTTYVEDGPPV
jgi:hypothetical protein